MLRIEKGDAPHAISSAKNRAQTKNEPDQPSVRPDSKRYPSNKHENEACRHVTETRVKTQTGDKGNKHATQITTRRSEKKRKPGNTSEKRYRKSELQGRQQPRRSNKIKTHKKRSSKPESRHVTRQAHSFVTSVSWREE